MSDNKKKQIAKITVFITSIFILFLSITYAFMNQTVFGTKRQVISSQDLYLSLEENKELTITNAMPMYDEVGMIQEAFKFKLINKSKFSIRYWLRLIDTTDNNKLLLDPSIIKYGLEKNSEKQISTIAELKDSVIDNGIIAAGQKIDYKLRLWIDSNVEENSQIEGKTRSYHLKIDAYENVLLSKAKQGDYIAYKGNNGCLLEKNGTTGTGNAENGNSCLGYNANESLTNNNTYGYCNRDNFKFKVRGWRIAYIKSGRAYLVSAGSPECKSRPSSVNNATYISQANARAKRYCNSEFVDGNCTDNKDSWAINDTDFFEMTKTTYGTGRHLGAYYSSNESLICANKPTSRVCGIGNDLYENGGEYWFAAANKAADGAPAQTFGIMWAVKPSQVYIDVGTGSLGLRPIIRLSSSVYITGGSGTMDDPYTIANNHS